MKFFVTGVGGQLGFDVVNEIISRKYDVVGSDIFPGITGNFQYVSLDVTDKSSVLSAIEKVSPDVVIHCAAWTAVDAAEDEENTGKVRRINVDGTRNIAEICKKIGCKMIYISTDYVFSGQGEIPWQADCKAFAPLNVYGRSKLDGEFAVTENLKKYFIVRIAWVFGKNGNNFVKTMLNLSKKYNEIKVVNDQIGTPTYTPDLARLLVDMAETEKYGFYHATNEGGFISWCDLAAEIFRQMKIPMRVIPVTTSQYGISKARRPFNSRLDKSKLEENGFELLPDWKDALARYLEEMQDGTN